VGACVVFAAIALGLTRGVAAPLGVLGGGLLIGVSYWAIKSSVTALTQAAAGPARAWRTRRVVVRTVVQFVGRYALLGLLAYVMIGRLRLHPIGLLAGVSSVVAAAAIEAARLLVRAGRR